MTDRLFQPAPEPARQPSSSAVEHVSTVDRCPRCESTIHQQTIRQGAFLRHGGYGATERTVTRSCSDCQWFTTVEFAEETPMERDS